METRASAAPAVPRLSRAPHPDHQGTRSPGQPRRQLLPARACRPPPGCARTRQRPSRHLASRQAPGDQPGYGSPVNPGCQLPAHAGRAANLSPEAGARSPSTADCVSRRRPPASPQKSHKSASRTRPTSIPRTRRHSAAHPGTPGKLSRICPLNSGNPAQVQGFPCWCWWSGAGSNCRPSAFQGAAFPQVSACTHPRRAIRVRHQCFVTIDLGSFAASPCAARSDRAAATSASRPSTACR